MGVAVVMAVLSMVYQPFLLFLALPFGGAGFLIWYQGTGRLEARIRRSVRRRADGRAEFDGGQSGRTRREWQERRERATSRRARQERAWRARNPTAGDARGAGAERRRNRGYGPGGYAPGATGRSGPSTEEAYRRLDLEPGSDPDRIREAYREKVKEVHPDTEDGDEEAFKRVNEAFETLEERVG